MDQVQHNLQQVFRLSAFRPGQREVIDALLAGRSALAVFPTGGGKSLCYQLPALQLPGLTLVVSPLIALMKDQVDALQALGVAAARLDSSLDAEQARALYQEMDAGRLKLLYVAPERLTNERFLARLKRLNISLMAIDEAHCVSEWGHNFRPDYLKLAEQAKALKVGRVLALTATATPEVAAQICESFGIAEADHVQTGFYRPNLEINVTACQADQRRPLLLDCLQRANTPPAIVYVTLQKTAEEVAAWLVEQGVEAKPYHAGLKAEQRNAVQEAFMAGSLPVVVATIAFGMGIDKADIRSIVHYNLPKSLENYMQEIGRAGRDGKASYCHLLACRDDLTVLENFSYGDTPESAAIAGMLEWLEAQSQQFDLSTYELSRQFDLRPLVLNTLLTYLELDGLMVATAPFYTEYKLAFVRPREEVIAQFAGERGQFLHRVFDAGSVGKKWLSLKPAEIAETLGQERSRIVTAINYLEQQGLVSLQVAGVRQGYRRTGNAINEPVRLQRLNELFAEREQRDMQRLQALCDWAETRGCLQQALVAWFGETLEQTCGECSGCQGQAQRLDPRRPGKFDQALIQRLHAEGHEALASPRQLARFLCGIASPAASRARLMGKRSFGALAEAPFQEVLAACERLVSGQGSAVQETAVLE